MIDSTSSLTEKNLSSAKEIIKSIHYITIATVSEDGQPWNSPVSAYYDKEFNFYWASYTENQHSKNIRENPRVFIVIYDSTAPEGTGEGLYMLAKAYQLNELSEVEDALNYRPESKKPREAKEYLGEYPRRMYKAVPEKFWINGDGEIDGNYIDVRFEVSLK
jgi:nitroimidazol reductase NimA-like FMN-containing flavoprotein (pyridoxamine 5'-phosphate oxidase superfamily)